MTSAANYQLYVGQLGTAEEGYETDNARQFVAEMKTIDADDAEAGDAIADADSLLTTTATDDEATLEETLAGAGQTYQENLGQAAHDDRQAVALAVHDLTLGIIGPLDETAQETHDEAVATAAEDQTTAENDADETFATTVQPVLTSTGTDEAEAQFAGSQTDDGQTAGDIEDDNAAVDGYDDQESADYDQQQKSEALALYNWQASDATGHAAAIAAFAAGFVVSPGNDADGNPLPGVPSPWAGLASDQAAAASAQQLAQATAQLTQSDAQADAQETQEQSASDALTAKDDGDAEAEQSQNDGNAESQETTDEAQADLPDAVFSDLPDRLVPPSDGPAPVLTPDSQGGYEANDFWLDPTSGNYAYAAALMSINFELFAGAAGDPGVGDPPYTAYNGQAFGPRPMPWGVIGISLPSFDPSMYSAPPDLEAGIDTGGGGTAYYPAIPFLVGDLLRNDVTYDPSQVYQQPTHFGGTNASLLQVSDTPSATGDWSTVASPLPSLTDAETDTAPPAPTSTPDMLDTDVPPPPASQEEPPPSNTATPPAAQDESGDDESSDDESADDTSASGAGFVTVVLVLPQSDPAAEPPTVSDRATGETATTTGDTQQQLANPDGAVQNTRQALYGPPANAEQAAQQQAASSTPSGSAANYASPGGTAVQGGANVDYEAAALESKLQLNFKLGRVPTTAELYLNQHAAAIEAIYAAGDGLDSDAKNTIYQAFVSSELTRLYREQVLNEGSGGGLDAGTVAWSATKTVAKGALIVVAAGAVAGTGPVGFTVVILVGVGSGVGGVGKAAYDRYGKGQTLGQSLVGGLAEIGGTQNVVGGLYNIDVGSQQSLNWTSEKRSEALGNGIGESVILVFGAKLANAAYAAVASERAAAQATSAAMARLQLAVVDTPYGPATQSATGEAFAVVVRTLEGRPLYKVGNLDRSNLLDAQFWSPISPATPNYAGRLGIPPANVLKVNFVEAGVIREGAPFVSRNAPGVGGNLGGEVEVVVIPYGVEVRSFVVRKNP